MRRFFVIAMALMLLVCLFAGTVSAQTSANSVNIYATVSSDESCQVTVTALLHLEQASGTVYFPVPAEAESVTLNGTRVTTTRTSSGRQVDLSGILGNLVGDFSVTITYILRDVVAYNEKEILQLQLPLLAGFAYPVENLEYSITLPGAVPAKPAFSSGYHKANIEQDLQTQQSGPVISGRATKTLKDHETLEMTLLVSEEMFPQNKIELPDFEFTKTFMWIFVALAVLYWAIFLRCGIPRRITSAAAPEGFSAGQIGSVLHMQGADLTAMVFTWAQLGYLFIGKGKGRNILLYKQMDMGNERSSFEQKCFRSLFGRRNVVDTGELHYVEQWQKINRANPGIQDLIHPKTGNKKIFRALAAGVGLFCGIGVGITLTAGAGLQWLWVILLALTGFLVSWHIHRWAESLFLRQKKHLWGAVVLSVLWLALSILAGSRRPSGLRKTTKASNSLAHRTTWLRSDLAYSQMGGESVPAAEEVPLGRCGAERSVAGTEHFGRRGAHGYLDDFVPVPGGPVLCFRRQTDACGPAGKLGGAGSAPIPAQAEQGGPAADLPEQPGIFLLRGALCGCVGCRQAVFQAVWKRTAARLPLYGPGLQGEADSLRLE